jgi:hypothetical protein
MAGVLFIWQPSQLAIAQTPSITGGAQQDSLKFLWNFVGANPVEKSGVKVSFCPGDTTLRTGTSLKFFFVPISPCYIYLFAQTSQGKTELLLPSDEQEMEKPMEMNKMITYPKADGWTSLDTVTGKETFYLLVSVRPLSSIEDAYMKLISSPSDSLKARQKFFASNVLSAMKKSAADLISIAVNPPVMGGSVRGFRESLPVSPKEIEFQNVVAKDLFARKIVVKHIR